MSDDTATYPGGDDEESEDFDFSDMSDDQIVAMYDVIELSQDSEIIADMISSDLHGNLLEASQALTEEAEERGLETRISRREA